MRNLIVHLTTGFCGEDVYEPFSVPYFTSTADIDEIAYEMAIEHAAMYGHESAEDLEYADGYWEDYNPEEHDMYRAGGGSFQEDFERLDLFQDDY